MLYIRMERRRHLVGAYGLCTLRIFKNGKGDRAPTRHDHPIGLHSLTPNNASSVQTDY